MSLLFEWDEEKAKRNLAKHGVSFEEASTIFSDSFELMIHDPLHSEDEDDPDLLEAYDFSNAVRGKHAERYAKGTNVVVLDSDLAELFPDSAAVNEALRVLVRAARECRTGRPVVSMRTPFRLKPPQASKKER